MSDNADNKSYEQAEAAFHRLVEEFKEHVEQQRQQQRPRAPDVQQQSNQYRQQRQQQQPAQHQIVLSHQQQMQAMRRQQAMIMQAELQRQQQQERPAPPEPTFTDLKEQVLCLYKSMTYCSLILTETPANVRFLYSADRASSIAFDVITSDDIPTPDPGPSVATYPTTAFVTKQGGTGLLRWILKSNPARTAYYAVLDLFLMTNKLINDQSKIGPEVGVSDARGRLYEAVGLHGAVKAEEE